MSLFWRGVLALCVFLLSSVSILLAAAPPSSRDTSTSARELVQAALLAEEQGLSDRRAELLAKALETDPNYAPARWQAGYVREGDHWATIDSIASDPKRAAKLSEYRQLRLQGRNTAAGHLKLAQWCAAAGLKEQERVHLFCAMQCPLTKNEALRVRQMLGLVRYQNMYLLPTQAERMKEETRKNDKVMHQWKSRLAAIGRGPTSAVAQHHMDALGQLLTADPPTAVPVFDALVAEGPPASAKTAVETIANSTDQAATDALVRYAVLADDEDTRQAASDALKPRSMFGYVPTLMSALESPVDVQFNCYYDGSRFRHQLALFQAGALMDQSFVSAGGMKEDVTVTVHPKSGKAPSYDVKYTPDQTLARDSLLAANQLMANDRRKETNERVTSTLRTATGNDLDSKPDSWWNWWLNYNEMYQPPYKPVKQVYSDTTPPPSTYRITSVSCFPAGTPVATASGPMPIEQLQIGDCVLSQNPDTGELAYKPVVATTLRPTSPVIAVRTADDTIRATRGHPFWVSGIGWRMTKELKAGQLLHTPSGAIPIESAESDGEAECHNLVVADFNSYFVGKNQVLVHDNNLRQVTAATVPGLGVK